MKNIVISIINFYRNYLSKSKLPSCRFIPTCSEYTLLAIAKKGLLKGMLLGALRILRCNPLNKGGYDPV